MTINRHRILFALGVAAATVPGALVPGVPKWAVACAALGAFLCALAKPEQVIAPGSRPTPAPPEHE
jgi:hypothetical protein